MLVFVWHLIVLLTYISLMTSDVEDYSYAGWPFKNIYLDHYPIILINIY